ncbi:hypothetical protein CBR_g12563 [Chara braunii]|uniref:Uncharacterized protein n=1 Tax=Chara braunii TaxID=69332 RepID=A0A388KSD0_CHABU|nr:hypothetical protein CBR_g12563 [Chara braunii]|eukprot:GBG72843.1 hypothetical protein CBR_g12563 [Chara braunii]
MQNFNSAGATRRCSLRFRLLRYYFPCEQLALFFFQLGGGGGRGAVKGSTEFLDQQFRPCQPFVVECLIFGVNTVRTLHIPIVDESIFCILFYLVQEFIDHQDNRCTDVHPVNRLHIAVLFDSGQNPRDAGAVKFVVGAAPFVDVVGGGTAPAALARENGVGRRILYVAVLVPAPHCAYFDDVATAGVVAAVLLQLAVAVVGVGAIPAAASVGVAVAVAPLGLDPGIVVAIHVVVVAVFAAVAQGAENAVVVATVAVVELSPFAPAVPSAGVDASSAAALAAGVDAVVVVAVVAVVVATAFDLVVPSAGVVVTSTAALAAVAISEFPGAVAVEVAAVVVTSASAPVVVRVAATRFAPAVPCAGAVVASAAGLAGVALPEIGDAAAV